VYSLNQLPLLLLPQALQQQRLPVTTCLLLQLLLAACLNKLCIHAKCPQPAAQPAQHAVNQEAGLHAAHSKVHDDNEAGRVSDSMQCCDVSDMRQPD
jgi:hypothetical protein